MQSATATEVGTKRAWITVRQDEPASGASFPPQLSTAASTYKGIVSANMSGPDGTEEDVISYAFPIAGGGSIEYLQSYNLQEGMKALKSVDTQLRRHGFEFGGSGQFWFQREYWRPYIDLSRGIAALGAELDEALGLHPNNAYVLGMVANYLLSIGDYDNALRSAAKAVALNAELYVANLTLMEGLYAKGTNKAAESYAQFIRKRNPKDKVAQGIARAILS